MGGGIEASLAGGDFSDVILSAGMGAAFGAICPPGAIGGLIAGGGSALGAYALGGDRNTVATAYQWGSLVGGLAGDFTGGALASGRFLTMRAMRAGLTHVGPDLLGAGVGAIIGYSLGGNSTSALHGANLGMMAGGIAGGVARARGLWGVRRATSAPATSFNPISAERVARYQAKVNQALAAGRGGEKLAELQGRVDMLREGFLKLGPGKHNRSGHGIDSIFYRHGNPNEFAVLESKWKASFHAGNDHTSLLGSGYGFRHMDNGWIDANIQRLMNSTHFPQRQRFGELLFEHGYQHKFMNVMNGSGQDFLFRLP